MLKRHDIRLILLIFLILKHSSMDIEQRLGALHAVVAASCCGISATGWVDEQTDVLLAGYCRNISRFASDKRSIQSEVGRVRVARVRSVLVHVHVVLHTSGVQRVQVPIDDGRADPVHACVVVDVPHTIERAKRHGIFILVAEAFA